MANLKSDIHIKHVKQMNIFNVTSTGGSEVMMVQDIAVNYQVNTGCRHVHYGWLYVKNNVSYGGRTCTSILLEAYRFARNSSCLVIYSLPNIDDFGCLVAEMNRRHETLGEELGRADVRYDLIIHLYCPIILLFSHLHLKLRICRSCPTSPSFAFGWRIQVHCTFSS